MARAHIICEPGCSASCRATYITRWNCPSLIDESVLVKRVLVCVHECVGGCVDLVNQSLLVVIPGQASCVYSIYIAG